MAANAPAERHPVQVTHRGVPKSKAERDTSTQPSASAKCIAIPEPLPSNTCVNIAIGSANNRTIDPRRPRGDRMLETCSVSCCAAPLGDVPTPRCSTLRGYSVKSRALSPASAGCFAKQIELYGGERRGTPVELPVQATGFSKYTR